jgi:hypothetical protein
MAQKKKQFDTYITLRFDATKADVLRAISWESNMRDGEAFAEFLVDALAARTGYVRD